MITDESCRIGGPGVYVGIDESKFEKRKHNRGHHVEGVWGIGRVEKIEERRLFVIPVKNRNTETITSIIERHVLPGSIIRADLWRGYSYLNSSDEYTHETVNHSIHLKNPVTGVYINTIEDTWSAIKARISRRYRCESALGDHLDVPIWRRQNATNLCGALSCALKDYNWLE
jgi:hypothetical protein